MAITRRQAMSFVTPGGPYSTEKTPLEENFLQKGQRVFSTVINNVAGTLNKKKEEARRPIKRSKEIRASAPRMLANAMNENMIAGALAGAITGGALYPLEVIKTQMQAGKGAFGFVCQQIMKEKGLGGFYSGFTGTFMIMVPISGLYYASYENVKSRLRKCLPESWAFAAFAGAAFAGSLGSSIIYVPGECLKQRTIMGPERTIMEAAKKIIATRGIMGLYAGYGATLLRNMPYTIGRHCFYEQLQDAIAALMRKPPTALQLALCGGVASGFAAALTTPIDVIKTRMQTSPQTYPTMMTTLTKVLDQDGYTGLFHGLLPRTLGVTPAAAIFFGIYAAVQAASRRLRQRPDTAH